MAYKGQKQTTRTKEEKFKITEPIIKGEKSQSKVSKETKINIGLIHLWINKYNDNGLNGLENKIVIPEAIPFIESCKPNAIAAPAVVKTATNDVVGTPNCAMTVIITIIFNPIFNIDITKFSIIASI